MATNGRHQATPLDSRFHLAERFAVGRADCDTTGLIAVLDPNVLDGFDTGGRHRESHETLVESDLVTVDLEMIQVIGVPPCPRSPGPDRECASSSPRASDRLGLEQSQGSCFA
jgi:hypothetical protein